MNDEQDIKMTDLDYLTASPHLQMIKAALPYIQVQEQRFFSLLVKVSELERTMRLFGETEEGMVGICSLEKDEPATPLDMLNAMKPYGSPSEQEFIDLIVNFLESSRIYQSYRDSTEREEAENASRDPAPDTIPSPASDTLKAAQVGGGERSKNNPRNQQQNRGPRFSIDQFKGMLPPEQQSRLETAQLLMQTFQQFS